MDPNYSHMESLDRIHYHEQKFEEVTHGYEKTSPDHRDPPQNCNNHNHLGL